MYVTKRGAKYRAWERVVDPDGTVHKISVTMDKDTPQARNKARKALEMKKPKPLDTMRYSDLVTAYIQFQKATVKTSTWTRNEASLKRLMKNFEDAKLTDMTSGFITAKLLSVSSEPRTFNEYLKRVKSMFRWAYRNDYIPSSACVDKIKPLKDDKAERIADKYLEADELKKVLEAASDYYSDIFAFLALSGLRIGELIALNLEDITEDDIIVRKTYDSLNGVMNTPKTEAGWRYVHMQPELKSCVRRIRARSATHRLRTGVKMPYFVVSQQGGRLSYTKANRVFTGLCERLVGRRLTLHALRHTHVALMAESVDLDAIARRCGHSNSKVTREIYFHVTKEQKAKDDAAFDAVSILA